MTNAGLASFGRLRDLPKSHLIFSRACGIDAYGVRGFGSAKPENKFSVAAFALHAIPAGCREVTVALFLHVSMVLL